MSDDADPISLIIAAINDEKTKVKLEKLRADIQSAQVVAGKACHEAMEQALEANLKVLAEVRGERREVQAQRAKFEDDKRAMTDLINSHNDERARWEKQRRIVEAQHAEIAAQHSETAAKHAEIAARHEQTDAAHSAAERALSEREAAVAAREKATQRQAAAMRAAMDAA